MLRFMLHTLVLLVLIAAVGTGSYFAAAKATSKRIVALAPSPTGGFAAAGQTPAATTTSVGTPANAAAVAQRLTTAVADPRLGAHLIGEVRDARTGDLLYDQAGSSSASPASTAKLTTATALLTVHAATDRLTTKVVTGATPGTVVLVGGGDPTLSAAPTGTSTPYPDAARLSDLAAKLKGVTVGGQPIMAVLYDTSLFTGPAISPDWDATDVPSAYGAPITALMADGGRDTPTSTIRSADPAGAAARAFAADLGISTVTAGTAPAGAATLASVQSAPLGELVGQMLSESDNVIAEMMARQVALPGGAPSFTGAAAAVANVLNSLGVTNVSTLLDGSGLARADRISPDELTQILHLDVTTPRLAAVLTGLPVAGWDGTLATRFTGSSLVGAGVVRAKTGTLTSVSSLAGVVHDADGRLLAFSFVADQVGPATTDTDAAEQALDAVAAQLATCGCSG